MAATPKEQAAVDQLVAAKETFRNNPTAANRKIRDRAVKRVQKIRATERQGRRLAIGGDAYEMES